MTTNRTPTRIEQYGSNPAWWPQREIDGWIQETRQLCRLAELQCALNKRGLGIDAEALFVARGLKHDGTDSDDRAALIDVCERALDRTRHVSSLERAPQPSPYEKVLNAIVEYVAAFPTGVEESTILKRFKNRGTADALRSYLDTLQQQGRLDVHTLHTRTPAIRVFRKP